MRSPLLTNKDRSKGRVLCDNKNQIITTSVAIANSLGEVILPNFSGFALSELCADHSSRNQISNVQLQPNNYIYSRIYLENAF